MTWYKTCSSWDGWSAAPGYGAGVSVRSVLSNGEIKCKGDLVYVSASLKGEPVDLVQQGERTRSVQFSPLLIGTLIDAWRRVDKTPVRVLPMYPV